MNESPHADALGERLHALVRLSACLGAGADDVRRCLVRARDASDAAAIEEIVLQSYLFVGFPTVLNVFAVWRELSPTPPATTDPDLQGRTSQGEEICRTVYGGAYERLRTHVAGLHPDLDRWMIEEGYGKTLSRRAVPVVERELCVVGLLAAAGHEPQLRSHLRGSLNAGASASQVGAALETGLGAAEEAPATDHDAEALRRAWADVRAKAGVV